MKTPLSLLLSLFAAGCVSIPHRCVTVVDAQGHPIRGACARAPYPIVFSIFPRDAPSANSTDSHGHVTLYDTTPGEPYVLRAVGYTDKSIPFPSDDHQTYVLQRPH